MSLSRQETAQQTSAALSAAKGSLASIRSLVGLDGFVDEIIGVVDKWTGPDACDMVPTIAVLAGKISRAAGQSSNYELIVKQMKLGGNGPIMANALAAIGMKVSYVGNVGYPTLHPVFQELADRAEEVISIAEPGHTDALEFTDGKLMLGKLATLKDINWDNIVARVGLEKFKSMVARSKLIGMVNWTMLPFMNQIWNKLREEVLPSVPKDARTIFVDLADPEKRTAADVREAMELLGKFQSKLDVILGLNLKEAETIAEVLGVSHGITRDRSFEESAQALKDMAAGIRQKVGISCVVIHPRQGAAAATQQQSAVFAGPFVKEPKISTGAGDHFNAGFCTGRVLGLSLEQSLCVGVATSGFYVREAKSPTADDLIKFTARLPAPQA